jgi:DNA polymerase-2
MYKPETQRGVLLTRQVFDRGDHLQISLWLKTANHIVNVMVENEFALFFVETQVAEQAILVLAQQKIKLNKTKSLPLKTFNQQPVTAFYFTTLQAFYAARDSLKQHKIKCYEDDIRPDERYLMERFITSTIEFTGNISDQTYYKQCRDSKCKSAEFSTKLKWLSFDIECSMQGDLYSIAAYTEHEKIVFMIGDKLPEDELNKLPFTLSLQENEPVLIRAFFSWLKHFDPDILIGWNVINFDMQLLQKRCELHHIAFAIGRDGSNVRWRQNQNTEQYFLDIAGRVVLDGIDLLKTATYNFASFSLDNVAKELLGIGKKVDDVDNRVAEITHNFHHNKLALAQYNLEDCRLVWLIFEKTQLLEFALLRAKLTGLALDRVGGSVAAFTNLYLPKLHRHGYIAPNMGDGHSDLVSPGGYVMDSIPGLYQNVLVLDFKSLYPSIIRTFFIDPMGLIEGLKAPEQAVPAYDGAFFSRDKHFLPQIIEHLWQARDQAKLEQNAALSQAIKIIMNSFYGVLGSTGCRFYDPRLSGAITKRGHEILKLTSQWLEQQNPEFKVIYGDTDSIFVHVGEQASGEVCLQLGKQLQQQLNQQWQQYLQEKYQLSSQLEIEFEQHFSQFLMPTIRGLDVGTKKRYAGLVEKNGTQRIVFKGLESVRTDWTELAKQFQQTLYLKIFNHQSVHEYINDMVAKTKQGEFDALLVFRKRLRRKLSHYVKNIPPQVRAARLADEQNKKLGKPLKYQNRGWIEYVMTLAGPQAKEYVNAPIDYQFYIDRQLEAVADAILPFIGLNFSQITADQLDLFAE